MSLTPGLARAISIPRVASLITILTVSESELLSMFWKMWCHYLPQDCVEIYLRILARASAHFTRQAACIGRWLRKDRTAPHPNRGQRPKGWCRAFSYSRVLLRTRLKSRCKLKPPESDLPSPPTRLDSLATETWTI